MGHWRTAVKFSTIDARMAASATPCSSWCRPAARSSSSLTPELRTAIQGALLGFGLQGTGLEGEFGSDVTKLVPVKYKDDWANTRRIDQGVASARNKKEPIVHHRPPRAAPAP